MQQNRFATQTRNQIRIPLQLLPDGPELIERFIVAEGDSSARRSAFLFLYNEAEELAIDFLNDHMDEVKACAEFYVMHLKKVAFEKVISCIAYVHGFLG